MVLIKSRSRPIFLEQRRALRTSRHASYFQKIMKWISYTYRVATGQGKVREIQGHGILKFVREIWNFVESQGNSRKVREI